MRQFEKTCVKIVQKLEGYGNETGDGVQNFDLWAMHVLLLPCHKISFTKDHCKHLYLLHECNFLHRIEAGGTLCSANIV